jgi:hypothetical protein
MTAASAARHTIIMSFVPEPKTPLFVVQSIEVRVNCPEVQVPRPVSKVCPSEKVYEASCPDPTTLYG